MTHASQKEPLSNIALMTEMNKKIRHFSWQTIIIFKSLTIWGGKSYNIEPLPFSGRIHNSNTAQKNEMNTP